ncbi:calponin homology domain-containing protein [Hyaloraphidium curvatum]|nr:calponin homology domain-containing protein [Hyaloraphidium curvatum]
MASSSENLSRSELLAWVNETCALAVDRIEDLGNGVAYAILLDSIFEDLPLKKLKWDARNEVDNLANFRVLQDAFARHKIDKPIPVQRLAKMSMAPNLEFLQFLRKFWVSRYPEGKHYDALGRRGEAPALARPSSSASVNTAVSEPAAQPPPAPRPPPARKAPALGKGKDDRVAKLEEDLAAFKEMVDAAIVERDFYFGKLRELEVLMQSKLQADAAHSEDLKDMLKEMEAILYATADGFAIPEAVEQAGEPA